MKHICVLFSYFLFVAHCQLVTKNVTFGSNSLSPPVVRITNNLGPTAVIVDYNTDQVSFQISYRASDNKTLENLMKGQPTQAVVDSEGTVTLNLNGEGNIAKIIGATCKEEQFSLQSSKPPCEPLRFTPSRTFTPPSGSQKGAVVIVTVPHQATICVNSYCSSPLYDAIPELSPQEFSKVGNGIVYDAMQGLMWHANLLPGNYTYFRDYKGNFDSINRGARDCAASGLGGFNDWRIPTRSELFKMTDALVSKPAQNTTFFPDDGAKDAALWTSIRTKVDDYNGVYFMIYGGDGGITYNGDVFYARDQRVRCVRTVINKIKTDRWVITSNNTALDTHTGLQWHRSFNATQVEADQGPFSSIEYCDSLTTDGYNDWRLPNHKELGSFTDESRAGPAWTVDVFPPAGSDGFFWASNRNMAFGNNNYWGMSSGDAVMFVNVSPAKARCVRGPDFVTAPKQQRDMRSSSNAMRIISGIIVVAMAILALAL